MKFEQLNLSEPVMKSIREKGFQAATPIQEQAMPAALAGQDVLGCAQTGTGKTVAFLVPIIERLKGERVNKPRAVVLAPTRELVLQIADEARQLAGHTQLRTTAIFGGSSMGQQIDDLKRGVDIIVATPGRLMDHMRRGNISYDQLQVLVLDEADRMLDMGFFPDIEYIVSRMPTKRQTMLFSATMPPEIIGLARQFQRDPATIQINPARPPAQIRQRVFPVPKHLKLDLLAAIIDQLEVESMLVFTRTKVNADMVSRILKEKGIRLETIHGDFHQKRRLSALSKFKQGKVQVLVATNVAARGLDIQDISHVVNFDVPEHAEDYVHRVGRTARAEAEGEALTLLTTDDEGPLARIEFLLGRKLPRERLDGFNYDVPAPSWAKPSFESLLEKARGEEGDKVDRWRSLARF